jgi:zinc finger-containing ubiquitin peptidase 1
MNQDCTRQSRPEASATDGVQVRDFCPEMPDDPASHDFNDNASASTLVSAETLHLTYDNGRIMRIPRVRLQGRNVLGPHAFETQMPAWQKHLLLYQTGSLKTVHYGTEPAITLLITRNESLNTIPALAALSAADPNVTFSAYSHPATNHYHKRLFLPGFCGYHSISSLLSYLRGAAHAPKHHIYATRIPSIPELQSLIEEGWNANINAHARTETGGILGTRKYIGTSEAETILRLLAVPCWTMRLVSRKGTPRACDVLMDRVGKYFSRNDGRKGGDPLLLGPAPVFLQFHGHSVVIVGFEKWRQRVRRAKSGFLMSLPDLNELVVFNSAVERQRVVEKVRDGKVPEGKIAECVEVLGKYRLSRYELEKYRAFELIFLEDPRFWL